MVYFISFALRKRKKHFACQANICVITRVLIANNSRLRTCLCVY